MVSIFLTTLGDSNILVENVLFSIPFWPKWTPIKQIQLVQLKKEIECLIGGAGARIRVDRNNIIIAFHEQTTQTCQTSH